MPAVVVDGMFFAIDVIDNRNNAHEHHTSEDNTAENDHAVLGEHTTACNHPRWPWYLRGECARGVHDVVVVAGAACRPSESRRAATRACGVVTVRYHKHSVTAAVRVRRARGACGVDDISKVTGVACVSIEPRQANTLACGVAYIRRH